MGIVATMSVAGIYALPGALPQIKQLFVDVSQAGGSKKQTGGTTPLPDMNKIIREVLDNTRDEVPLQDGGGTPLDKDESIMFLGSLAIASLAGISLAVMRNKKQSRGSV